MTHLSPALKGTPYRLRGSQSLSISLPEGSELFCSHGHIYVTTSPLAQLPSEAAGLGWHVYQGQSWRAPDSLHIKISPVLADSQITVQEPVAANAVQDQRHVTHWLMHWWSHVLHQFRKLA